MRPPIKAETLFLLVIFQDLQQSEQQTLLHTENSDILVMKTSSTGAVIWAIKAGGTGPDRAYSVAVDDNGNSYITGYFYNSATFGSYTATGQDRDVYAAKIDANGNFVWVQNCGGEFW